MTIRQLADYLINHDFEVQIIKQEYEVINLRLVADGIYAQHKQIVRAVAIAREDNYIGIIEAQMYPKKGLNHE